MDDPESDPLFLVMRQVLDDARSKGPLYFRQFLRAHNLRSTQAGSIVPNRLATKNEASRAPSESEDSLGELLSLERLSIVGLEPSSSSRKERRSKCEHKTPELPCKFEARTKRPTHKSEHKTLEIPPELFEFSSVPKTVPTSTLKKISSTVPESGRFDIVESTEVWIAKKQEALVLSLKRASPAPAGASSKPHHQEPEFQPTVNESSEDGAAKKEEVLASARETPSSAKKKSPAKKSNSTPSVKGKKRSR